MIKNTVISFIVSVITLIALVNMPVHYLSLSSPNLGALALTDIQSTDTLSDFPTVQNANNTLIETVVNSIIGTTTNSTITSLTGLTTASALVSIGTITTGTWNADVLTVSFGGTGSTTLSAKQILLGNGTGGIEVVAGFGTSGQFLTSNGNAAVPTWQTSAVDTTIDYNFTSSIFNIKNLFASSTVANPLRFNGVSYTFPSSANTASSTVLTNDGSGNLTFNTPDWILLSSTTTAQTLAIATSTIAVAQDIHIIYYQPTVWTTNSTLKMTFNDNFPSGNYGWMQMQNGGVATQNANRNEILLQVAATTTQPYVIIDIANLATKRKVISFTTIESDLSSSIGAYTSGAGIWDNSSEAITSVQFLTDGGSLIPSGTIINIYGR